MPLPEPLLRSTATCNSGRDVNILQFGEVDYLPALQAMSRFATDRKAGEQDQVWLLQHPPVYTQGTSCVQQPLRPSGIPLVKTDRGGQITYHGPGQVVMYPLLRIRDYGLDIKGFVAVLEQAVINLLADHGMQGERRADAPGVYVGGAKIAALGLRIRRGTSYHGLSLNVDMDLGPFSNIDPCGFAGMQVTSMQSLRDDIEPGGVPQSLAAHFLALV